MDPAKDLAPFCQALEEFRAGLSSAQARTGDDSLRQELGALGERLKTSQAQFVEEYRTAAAAMDRQIEQAQQQAQQALERAGEAREQLAAARAAPPPKPEVPAEPDPVDPKWGQVLRREILKRFGWLPGPNGSSRRNGDKDREIWEDWEGM